MLSVWANELADPLKYKVNKYKQRKQYYLTVRL